MSTLYNRYLQLKQEKCDVYYLFKYGIFYIFLDDDAKDIFFQTLMKVYMDSKKNAREKFTPKKYRKHTRSK